MKANILILSTCTAWFIGLTAMLYSQDTERLLAFPEAHGFGKYTQGGRNGQLIFVTNLNADGQGSFKSACEAKGPRIVVFKVSGTINQTKNIKINHPYLTIAGQTAPDPGITIQGGTIKIQTSEVVMRNLRVRKSLDQPGDGIEILSQGNKINNVIIDHCSLSWATDENLGVNGRLADIENVTIQRCIIAEGLTKHSMGMLVNRKKQDQFGPNNITVYNNLFISNAERTPAIGLNVSAEIINNVVFNWAFKGTQILESKIHLVGNYYKAGPNTVNPSRAVEVIRESEVYLNGNISPGRPNDKISDFLILKPEDRMYGRLDKVIIPSGIPYMDAKTAEKQVLDFAGAQPRDPVDQRLIFEYRNEKGSLIASEKEVGGAPVLNSKRSLPDSDGDGIPDIWEAKMGLDHKDNKDGGYKKGNGLSNFENYLNLILKQ